MCARLSGQMQELIREARNPMSLAQVCLRAYLSLIFIVIEMQFKNIYIWTRFSSPLAVIVLAGSVASTWVN